jgi:hypothetical protein
VNDIMQGSYGEQEWQKWQSDNEGKLDHCFLAEGQETHFSHDTVGVSQV